MGKTIGLFEIKFPEGAREIEMDLKKMSDIENCTEGSAIVLFSHDDEQYTGFFHDMDGD